MKKTKNPALLDYWLLVLTATLIGIGFIMIFSSSYQQSVMRFELSPTHFAQRQLQWIIVGAVAMLFCAAVNYRIFDQTAAPLLGVIVVLLVAVLLFGEDIYGSRRTLFGGSIQPGEAAKLVMVIFSAAWLSSKGDKIKGIVLGLLPFSVVLGVVVGLIVLEPNLSTATLITLTALTMFFIAGATWRQVALAGTIFLITCAVLFTRYPHARQRIEHMLAAGGDPTQSTNQQGQMFGDAFTNGGLFGRGLGNSDLKTNMPLPWTDGIVSVIGEELGLPGTLFTVALYLALTFRGLRIASQARDGFGFLLAFGITIALVFQAIVHVAAATGLGPLTGVTLPFISYGGSSLVINMAAIGILMSVASGGSERAWNGVQWGGLLWNWNGNGKLFDSRYWNNRFGRAAPAVTRFDFWRRDRRPRLSRPRRLPGPASATANRARKGTGGQHIPRPGGLGGRSTAPRAVPSRQLASSARARSLGRQRRPVRR